MKRSTAIILATAAGLLGAVVLISVLNRRLPSALERRLIPGLESRTGLQVELGPTRLALLRRRVALSNLQLKPRNEPALLTVDSVRTRFRLLPLLHRQVRLPILAVDGAHLRLVRDETGRLNFPQGRTGPDAPGAGSADTTPHDIAPDRPAGAHPALEIGTALAELHVTYTDREIANPPFELALDCRIELHGIATAGAGATPGSFAVRGHRAGAPAEDILRLAGTVHPVGDPRRLSFTMEGSVTNVDAQTLALLEQETDMACRAAAASVQAVCRDGEFQPESSRIELLVEGPRLTGRAARRAGGIRLPPRLTVRVPLRGTIDDPRVNLEHALLTTVLRNVSVNLDGLLDSATVDGKKLDEDVKDTLKQIGEAFLKQVQ